MLSDVCAGYGGSNALELKKSNEVHFLFFSKIFLGLINNVHSTSIQSIASQVENKNDPMIKLGVHAK